MAIPWPDKIMHSVALYVTGNDEYGRMVRRTLMRYLNLTLILVLRSISSAVKRRFPTLEHLVEAGFMTSVELEMYQSVPSVEFNTYWIPCTWFINLLKETKKGSRITDSHGLQIIMQEFNEFRSKCGLLWSFDWVSLPLVYTQVVTIATYSFFLAALVGRQYVEERSKSYQMEVDIYVPVFTILQFFFYMGLLKVAEQLINPFGDDDEDFELNWLIDRHTKVSYLGVDTLMARSPPLVKDKYFDDVNLKLPYTEASVAYKKKTYRGSVHDMQVPEEKYAMYLPEIMEEDEERMTPGGSVQNLKAATFGSTAAAAAGIWRNQPQSSKNIFKYPENLEVDHISVCHLEEGLAQPAEFTVLEPSMNSGPPKEYHSKGSKPLARSESAPGRRPSLILTQWSSSSTLCKSDSLQMSEISIDVDVSQPGIDTPLPQSQPQQYSPLTYEQQKHHSFSGGDLLNVRPVSSSISSLTEPKLSPSCRRALIGKFKSLPKLIPVKRNSSLASSGSSSRAKKGVRWKPMTDSSDSKYLYNHELEMEKLYSSAYDGKYKYPIHNRYNSLDIPDVKFADHDFPVLKTKPDEPLYCDLCKKRIQQISASPNPEALGHEVILKHSVSAPLITDEHIEKNFGHDRSHSWQNKFLDRIRFRTRRRESSLFNELQHKPGIPECVSFSSQSVPNIAFWTNFSLPTACQQLEDTDSKFVPVDIASKESLRQNVLPLVNSASAELPSVKTLLIPNPEVGMDATSLPISRKNSDILSESSIDASSWKSADWTTLLGGNVWRS
ncbi:hypothetical protein B7P43_G10925 [Cryptotermes secundus]|nr:bestrophin-1 isoform X3 [Cryptotermes secundus]XP_023715747.1 bestrophin-1 isoform X3 [Cryptotermes secundus]XP_023715748.1 bestrophin-1 isoform X3 [Cryptotermes secundus]XP_023715749.1 bestrophin-1 isoform X3 [Cryptotermes secundus]XP_033609120.1 bestrophin-1 isoform X3 [Cryptotermes secundus]XP_033609121.1 bestrophin-1 isoform X3 [Cryptotermes secundus]PNF25364.1 hypothetical protein B7P43_G10925 [Cryptotermes secundus]